MSLLNDALKAAEQRQGKPAPSPYTGQPSEPARRRGAGKLAAVLVLVVAVAVLSYVYLLPAPAPVPQTADIRDRAAEPSEEETAPRPVEQEPANVSPEASAAQPLTATPVAEPGQNDGAPSPEPEPEPEPVMTAVEVSGSVDAADERRGPEPPVTGESREAAPQQSAESSSREPGPASAPALTVAPERPAREASAGGEAEPQARDDGQGEMSREPSTAGARANNVKQPRQSPEQMDRDTARAVREQLAMGEQAEAEQLVSRLTAAQDAPDSRYALARGVLARGDVAGALEWVPAELALEYPDLRLIRARALLAGEDLDAAVATLQRKVPPMADNVEYRVTLATLLQQQGNSDQAANHWAQLIAWDDSQGPWWVGLAIALEGRGDARAARRAYEQAGALPGLPPSLADYVRQRLQTLGAG